ncbi:hypothetical protein KXR53_32235 [Inquilinus limosus]
MRADAGQVDEPVDRAEQVIGRDVPLEVERVEQRLLHHRPLAQHRCVLLCPGGLNQDFTPPATTIFSTRSARSGRVHRLVRIAALH